MPPRICKPLQPFGTTIFTEISRLALAHNAINLGQGFPNFDGPDFIKQAAINAMRVGGLGQNQYARMFGVPPLNAAIAEHAKRFYGQAVDPEAHVTVTSGCTEAIAAALLGILEPGDEVIIFEPYYDSYMACIGLARAVPRIVTLHAPALSFDERELRSAISPRTKAIMVNTPHNPTGKVFTRAELELIASVCMKHNLIAITDEVYEHLVFEVPPLGAGHIRFATLPGVGDRTITLSSIGKTFSLTGWKIGWAIAPPDLTAAVRAAHQFLTFATATPLQHGAAAALRAPQSYFDDFTRDYRAKRDLLMTGLREVGFNVMPSNGTYFIMADHTPFGFADDVAFCRHLIEHVGVAAIPPSVFYSKSDEGNRLVRFAFCKDESTLREAITRMKAKL
jgi:aspartate/methionine/tyrosine aminotransferase